MPSRTVPAAASRAGPRRRRRPRHPRGGPPTTPRVTSASGGSTGRGSWTRRTDAATTGDDPAAPGPRRDAAQKRPAEARRPFSRHVGASGNNETIGHQQSKGIPGRPESGVRRVWPRPAAAESDGRRASSAPLLEVRVPPAARESSAAPSPFLRPFAFQGRSGLPAVPETGDQGRVLVDGPGEGRFEEGLFKIPTVQAVLHCKKRGVTFRPLRT